MVEELRDQVYWWSQKLVKKGYRSEGIVLLLSTWNFAYMRYVMRKFNLEKFENILDKCNFEYFSKKKFEKLDFTDEEIRKKIKELYYSLSSFKGIRYVGATKIMHIINPKVFLMWDSKIIRKNKVDVSPEGYLDFMIKMQKKYKTGKFGKLRIKDNTIPRAIDIYNLNHA